METTEFEQVKQKVVELSAGCGRKLGCSLDHEIMLRCDGYARALRDVYDWILDKQGLNSYGGVRGEKQVFPGLDAPYQVLGPVPEKEEFGGGLVRNCGSCGHAQWPEDVSTSQEKSAVYGKCMSPMHCLPVSFGTIEKIPITGDCGHGCPAWRSYKEVAPGD